MAFFFFSGVFVPPLSFSCARSREVEGGFFLFFYQPQHVADLAHGVILCWAILSLITPKPSPSRPSTALLTGSPRTAPPPFFFFPLLQPETLVAMARTSIFSPKPLSSCRSPDRFEKLNPLLPFPPPFFPFPYTIVQRYTRSLLPGSPPSFLPQYVAKRRSSSLFSHESEPDEPHPPFSMVFLLGQRDQSLPFSPARCRFPQLSERECPRFFPYLEG